MSQISLIDPSRDVRWDAFVENHPFGWICHLSGWKDVLEKSFSHMRGHYPVLFDDGGVNIKAALPFFEVNSWLTGKRLVSIPYATLCDPLISSQDDMMDLYRKLLELSKELAVAHAEIRTLSSTSHIPEDHFAVKSLYCNHYLHLDPDPEKVKKNFHRTCVKQRIKRAHESRLKLKTGTDEKDLQTFYQFYLISRKQLRLPPQPYNFFKNLWDTFFSSKKISLLLAELDGSSVGGLILFKFKDRVSAEFMVMNNVYRSINPNHFLFWEAIKTACYEGYKIFDFGRTSHSNTALMDFKKRWGTHSVEMPQFYFPKSVCESFGEKENSISYKFIRNLCDKAPNTVFKTLGHFCYKHLG